jgi:neutral ceramidase
MSQLQAGVYRVDITPPVGISMVGYYARDGVSQGVERPLTATALVLATESAKIAIVSCDLIFIQSPDVDEIRRDIAAAIGTEWTHVLINCSHTHCGPTLPSFMREGDGQGIMQANYVANLKRLLPGCAAAANHSLRPARVGSGIGAALIGINRREKDADGRIFLGENPGGPMDPDVGVVRIDDREGRPIAMLFSYGCHTVTMGPRCLMLTPDFPGPARELIERATGAKALYLQAAAGDINPITGIGATEDDTENMTRLGVTLGAEALKTAMQIRTHQKRGPRALFSSLSKNSLFPYVPVENGGVEIAAASAVMNLPLMPLPSLEDARRILEMRKASLEKAIHDNIPWNMLTIYRRFCDWAAILVRTVESGVKKPTVPLNVQVMRIGDLGLAAVSGETLVELGLGVKKSSPFEKTIFLGYSNGCISYIPMENAYPPEGWSPWETYSIPDMLFQTYQVPMALAPACGAMIVSRCLEMLNGLAGAGKASRNQPA